MGRAAITVNHKVLQELVNAVEAKQAYPNITALCQAVSEADTAMTCCKAGHKAKTIHYGQVYLAIKNGLVTVTTQKGKRGTGLRSGGSPRKKRAEKFSANEQVSKFISNLRKDAPPKYSSLIDKAEAGNTAAIVRLKCIQCYGYTKMHQTCDNDGVRQPPCGLYALNLMYWPNRTESDRDIYDPMSKK